MSCSLKCRKCRHIIVKQEQTSILNVHNVLLSEINNSVERDCGGHIVDVWYLQETDVPDWILQCIDEVREILLQYYSYRHLTKICSAG